MQSLIFATRFFHDLIGDSVYFTILEPANGALGVSRGQWVGVPYEV